MEVSGSTYPLYIRTISRLLNAVPGKEKKRLILRVVMTMIGRLQKDKVLRGIKEWKENFLTEMVANILICHK